MPIANVIFSLHVNDFWFVAVYGIVAKSSVSCGATLCAQSRFAVGAAFFAANVVDDAASG